MQDSTTTQLDPRKEVQDGGPIYTETDVTKSLPEPWNGFSSLSFVVAGIWWLVAIRKVMREYVLFSICMAVLIINGIGSTLFHATRASKWFFLMDYLPIMTLGLVLIFFLWGRALPKWWMSFIVVPAILGLIFWVRIQITTMNHQAEISLGYGMMAVAVLIPLVIHLIRTKGRHFKWMLLGGVMYAIGMFFREADRWEPSLLPMGTHWLWHVFNGFGAAAVTAYVFCDLRSRKAEKLASV